MKAGDPNRSDDVTINQGAAARIAQIIEKTPWGDIENSVEAIDFYIRRLEFVLAPQVGELDSAEGWPAWLDGRVSTEESADPAGLNHSEKLLLIAALVRDIKLNWRAGSGLANSANVLDACLATFHQPMPGRSEDCVAARPPTEEASRACRK